MRHLASASGLASTSGRSAGPCPASMRAAAAQLLLPTEARLHSRRRHRGRRRRLVALPMTSTSTLTMMTTHSIALTRPCLAPPRIAATSDDQSSSDDPDLLTPAAAAAPTPLSSSSSSSSSSSFATPAGRSLVELAAAWDALAPRLPAVSSAASFGSGASSSSSSSSEGPGQAAAARVILDALKLAVSRAPPRPVLPISGEGTNGSSNSSSSSVVGNPTTSLSPPPPPAALAASAALGTASRLADLASQGLPLDADAIAAGIVADAAAEGRLSVADAAARLGPGPAALLSDVLALRGLPRRADCYDDDAAARLREEALACYDGRAAMVEVARRAAAMSMGNNNNGNRGNGNESGSGSTNANSSSPAPPSSFSSSSTLVSPAAARQVAALEALQLYGPLGHALGMGPVAAELEDACFQELFPSSYAETATWLRREAGAYRSALDAAAARLQRALDDHNARNGGELDALASRCEVVVRTKSLFSTMKKLLRLDDLSAGGRDREALFDLLGMRVVVHPREGDGGEGAEEEGEEEEEEETVVFSSGSGAASFSSSSTLPSSSATSSSSSSSSQAERDAIAACYLVRDVASSLWPCVPGRSKDYIASPKANGYASLHLTVRPFGGAEAAVVDLREKRGGDRDDENEDESDGSGFETGSGYETDGSAEASSGNEDGPALELQIRTARMHASAEFGEAAHTAYKGGLARERAAALAAWTAAAAASAASDWSSSSEDDDGGEGGENGLPLSLLPAGSTSPVPLLPPSSSLPPQWSKRRQAAAALFAHLDANGDGRVSVDELASALRDMSFSNDDDASASSSFSEELSSVARRLMATAKKGSSLLCSEEEAEEEDSLSLDAFLEMMNQSGASADFGPAVKEGAACIDSDDDDG